MSQTTTAIFLYIGMDAERRRTKQEWPHTGDGFLGVVDQCDTMADALEEWYEAYAEIESPDWPGCFDYEITEEMGSWLFNNFNCGKREFKDELDRRVKKWMADDAERTRLWRENDARLETTQ